MTILLNKQKTTKVISIEISSEDRDERVPTVLVTWRIPK